jgi:hypothetical protein
MLCLKLSTTDNRKSHSTVTRSLIELLKGKKFLVLKNKGLTFYYIAQSKLNFLFSHVEISDKKSDETNEKSYNFDTVTDRNAFIRALVYSVFDDHYYYYTGKLKIIKGKIYEILTLFIRYRVEYIERLIISRDTYTKLNFRQDKLSFQVFNSPERVRDNEDYYRYHNGNYSGRNIHLLQKLNGDLFDDQFDRIPDNSL